MKYAYFKVVMNSEDHNVVLYDANDNTISTVLLSEQELCDRPDAVLGRLGFERDEHFEMNTEK